MKKYLNLICVALAVACIGLTVGLAFSMADDNSAAENTAEISTENSAYVPGTTLLASSDLQLKLALLHIYGEAQSLTDTLPFTTITMTQTAITRAFIGKSDAQAALTELNERVDRTLNSAFSLMDEITAKYTNLLSKNNISSGSSYRTKLSDMKTKFASLKNSSNELIARTRTLINAMNGDYDNAYTRYSEQLSDLSNKIINYATTFETEYEAFFKSICEDYDIVK